MVQHSLIGAYGQAGQWEDAIAAFRALQEGEVIDRPFSFQIVAFRRAKKRFLVLMGGFALRIVMYLLLRFH